MPPVDAQAERQQEFAQAVAPPDVRQLMRQHEPEAFAARRKIVRQQNDRAQNAECERRAAAFGGADARRARQTELRRERGARYLRGAGCAKCPHHTDTSDREIQPQQRRAAQPDEQNGRDLRRPGLRRPGLRRLFRSRRECREWECIRKCRHCADSGRLLQQIPEAQVRRNFQRQQQARRRDAPQRGEQPPRQAILQRQPQREHKHDQRAAAERRRQHAPHPSYSSTSAFSRATSSFESERSDKMDANSSSAEPPNTFSTSVSASSFCAC